MNISVLITHPDNQSFNHAIANSAVEQLKKNVHGVVFHDLYAEQFDPVLPSVEIPTGASLPPEIAQHCDEIASADGIVIVHPNWSGRASPS